MRRGLRFLLAFLSGLGLVGSTAPTPPVGAAAPARTTAGQGGGAPAARGQARHDDARIEENRGLLARARPAAAVEGVNALRREIPDLAVEYDDTTAAVRSLSNHVGYLTGPHTGLAPMAVALAYVRENLAALGLEPADLAGYEVTDRVYSKVTGATHVYLRQRYRGLPVYNAQLQVNVNRDGRIISVNNSFLPGLARAAGSTRPALGLARAVESAAAHLAIPLRGAPRLLSAAAGVAH